MFLSVHYAFMSGYNLLSENLDQIKAKELEADKKIELINENLELEHRVENKMA